MAVNNIQDKLLKAIDIIVEERLKSLSSSVSYVLYAKISNIDAANKKAICRINEQNNVVPYIDGLTLNINDVVVILVPNGNLQNKFILCKKPNF